MPEIVTVTYNYLVFIQLHPLVTGVVLIIIALGRQRWEEVEQDNVKRRTIGQRVLLAAFVVSVAGQLSLYWPDNSHTAAIDVFMALGQVGVASFIYTFVEKFGILDRLGHIVQKKFDDKGGVA